HAEDVAVQPGLHYPKAGRQPVVWVDAGALGLRGAKAEGVENEQVLSGTPDQAAEGLRKYQEWKDARAAMVTAGSVPHYQTILAERFAGAEEAAGIAVETVTL